MGKYLKTLKILMAVWLVLVLAAIAIIKQGLGPEDYWTALISTTTFFLFPPFIFFYCVRIPIRMALDNTFADKPVSATVLTWRKVFYFFASVTVLLGASAGYVFILYKVILPFLDENGM